MCEARVYLVSEQSRQEIMHDVTSIEDEKGMLILHTLLGERKMVRGRLVRLDFLNHVVIVEPATAVPTDTA